MIEQFQRSLTVLGTVGEAAGKRLHIMRCEAANCTDAIIRCRATTSCDTVEITSDQATDVRAYFTSHLAMNNPGYEQPRKPIAVAVLRASWQHWVTADAADGALAKAFQSRRKLWPQLSSRHPLHHCKNLTRIAHSRRPGTQTPWIGRRQWPIYYCDEYAAAAGDSLPDLGRALKPITKAHCPVHGTDLLILTYANRASRWLCALLRTFRLQGVTDVTVLGWHPAGFARANKFFYFAHRVHAMLVYLRLCAHALTENASILFTDEDEMLQIGVAELRAAITQRFQHDKVAISMAAERNCVPIRLRSASAAKTHETLRRLGLSTEALTHAEKHWPACANAGNFVARGAAAAISLLNRTCKSCRLGAAAEDVYTRTTLQYSQLAEADIYNDQVEVSEQYAESSLASVIALDVRQSLFMPVFRMKTGWDLLRQPDGRLVNKWTAGWPGAGVPAFVHFNGDAKAMTGAFSPASLYSALLNGTTASGRGGTLFPEVSFLGPSFERAAPSTQQVCASIGFDPMRPFDN